MANTPFTTASAGTKALNLCLMNDKLAFRATLDRLYSALRADWIVFQHRNDLESREGLERGHAAASAWDAFLTALNKLHDLTDIDDDLRSAVNELSKIAPEHFPDIYDLADISSKLQSLSKKNKRLRPVVAELLFEAQALVEAFRGNLEIMSIPRTA